MQAILLPGVVVPAEAAFGGLLAALAGRAEAVARDLELYAADEPPPDYRLETEVDGILRAADAHGFERFHLVGYSAGGASAFACACAHGARLLSLALLEPAWAGRDESEAEARLRPRFRALERLAPDEQMAGFVRLQLAPGVEPPPRPDGPPPPWMATRPAGIRAVTRALETAELSSEALRGFERPVYFALGGRSNPDLYARMARRLEGVVPDFTLETFAERHHFDPPHRVEPERLAASLLALWERAKRG